MIITFFSQKRKYRSLLAFSLMELLIVIAIIGILSAVLISRHTYMQKNQQFMQCRANILEVVDWLEAYRVANGFYPQKDANGGNIGSASNPNSFRCISPDEGEMGKELPGFPIITCPWGTRTITSTENKQVRTSYSIRIRWDEYTVQCSMHGWGLTRYEHLKGQAHGDFINERSRVNGEGYRGVLDNP